MHNVPVTVVLLVNTNLERLRACVGSIERSINEPHQICFVSKEPFTPETQAYLTSLPGGFAPASAGETRLSALYNLGIQSTSSDFVLLLDSNTLAGEGWYSSLCAAASSDTRVAAVGSLCVDPESQTILHAGIELAEDNHPLYYYREEFFERLETETLPVHPLAVQTNGMLLRRTALERVGYFNETYRANYQDIDLCLRLREAAYVVSLVTTSPLFQREVNDDEKLLHRRADLETLRHTVRSSASIKQAVVKRRRGRSLASPETTVPLVSVLYPAFNDQQFLAQNIDSIINQTYRNWELIIVNDASSDSTSEILAAYQKAYSENIRVIEKQNHDRYEAWDMLYEAARGKYLAIIGADDVFLPEKLALQVELLEADPSLPFVHSDIYRIDENGHLIAYQEVQNPPLEQQLLRLLERNYLWTPAVLFSKEAVEDAGGWMRSEFGYAQDYDLWLRLLKGKAQTCISRPLVKYRVHSWGLTQVAGPKQMNNWVDIVVQEKLRTWMPDELYYSWNLHTSEGIMAFFKEAKETGFPGQFGHDGMQTLFLDFFKPILDREFADRCIRQARTEFFFRVSDYFLHNRGYRVAAVYALRAIARDGTFVVPFFRLLMRRFRRSRGRDKTPVELKAHQSGV
jgi:glycosyltransferase involved in cell wall biosynthesis